jgi:predicted short-subunit dehydrogenase-like oxidoreductase (DUF2520 family)
MRELEREPSADAALPAGESSIAPLAVIGCGRVGRSIAAAAERAGLAFRLAGRDDALIAAYGSEIALLCVPDAEIEAACETLAGAVPPLRFVGHTSGATALGALAAARNAGAEGFSLHPLQTIPDGATALAGAPCAIAGSSGAALELARELAGRLAMRPFEVPDEARAAYHAAAAMASNLLVALEESAAGLLDRAGMDRSSRGILAPLVVSTVESWVARGPEALTGPVTRGDDATIERHVEALREIAPELLPVYEALTERARSLAGPTEAVRC